MILSKIVVAVVLAWASLHDLLKKKVPGADKIFFGGLLLAVVFGGLGNGAGFAGSMLVQGFLAGMVGLLIRFVSTFGGADIEALILASAVYPDILLFKILASLLLPMLLWLKVYGFFSRSRTAPALPGILAGYLIMLSYLGI